MSSLTTTDESEKRVSFLNEAQQIWLAKAKDFAARISLAEIIEADEKNIFRRDLFEAACKEGLGALPFPSTYGGSAGDYLSFVLVNEEFARKCVPITSSLGVHVLCQEPIYRFGTDEQKSRYLPLSATGEFLAAFALTEPGAGSDTAALSCTARYKGTEYILNGTKIFITSGAAADYFIVMARLLDAPERLQDEKSITAFIVEKNFPGFQIGQKFNMLGMRGYSTCELVFSDCRVPAENLLGAHGQGRAVALSSLARGRVTIAAQCTGWAQAGIEQIIKHAGAEANSMAARRNCDRLLASVGELSAAVESARAITYQAASAIDRGEADVLLASMAKTHASDLAMKVATEAMTLIGADSAEPGRLLERVFRDAKAGQIYEGSNQIQRMLIARELLRK